MREVLPIGGKSKGDYLSGSDWLSVMEAFQFLDANGKGFRVHQLEMPEAFCKKSLRHRKGWALANYLW